MQAADKHRQNTPYYYVHCRQPLATEKAVADSVLSPVPSVCNQILHGRYIKKLDYHRSSTRCGYRSSQLNRSPVYNPRPLNSSTHYLFIIISVYFFAQFACPYPISLPCETGKRRLEVGGHAWTWMWFLTITALYKFTYLLTYLHALLSVSQNIELSNHKLRSVLKSTVWLQCTPYQTDRQTDEHRGNTATIR